MAPPVADILKLGTVARELKIGKTFTNPEAGAYHSIKYDFKPASIDHTKVASLEVGRQNEVNVTVQHSNEASVSETVFKGFKTPSTKDCVLIIDRVTGEITLERLSSNIQLKRTRNETMQSKTVNKPEPAQQTQQIGRRKSDKTRGRGRPTSQMKQIPAMPPKQTEFNTSRKTQSPSSTGGQKKDKTLTSLPMIGIDEISDIVPDSAKTTSLNGTIPKVSSGKRRPKSQIKQIPMPPKQTEVDAKRKTQFTSTIGGQNKHKTLTSLPMIGIDEISDLVRDSESSASIAAPAPVAVPTTTPPSGTIPKVSNGTKRISSSDSNGSSSGSNGSSSDSNGSSSDSNGSSSDSSSDSESDNDSASRSNSIKSPIFTRNNHGNGINSIAPLPQLNYNLCSKGSSIDSSKNLSSDSESDNDSASRRNSMKSPIFTSNNHGNGINSIALPPELNYNLCLSESDSD